MDFENNGNEFLCVVVSRKTHSPKCPIGFGLVLFLEFPWAYIYCLILSIIQVLIATMARRSRCQSAGGQPCWWVSWWVIVQRGASALYQLV